MEIPLDLDSRALDGTWRSRVSVISVVGAGERQVFSLPVSAVFRNRVTIDVGVADFGRQAIGETSVAHVTLKSRARERGWQVSAVRGRIAAYDYTTSEVAGEGRQVLLEIRAGPETKAGTTYDEIRIDFSGDEVTRISLPSVRRVVAK